ncbi:MAG: clostripain-related cysteine peptidase, partial [Methanoregula sp.]|nr:clostripain-related cysteine peptidase [Methanoregula sp.]
FDACLMASLEVAKTVQPYTRVMLGSEEIQRGSYEYTYLIQPLITNPETDAVTLARTLVDSYVDSKTPAGKSKTMAIIDVTKIPAIKTSLDKLGEELIPVTETDQGLYDLKGAYNDAIRLGVTNGESPTSVDLVSLLQNIKKKRPEVSPQVDTVIGQIRGAVIYERHNDYSQAVSGISIASPDAMDTSQYTRYGDGVKIAPNWDLVFQKVVAVSHDGSSGTGSKMAVSGSSVSDDDEEDDEERDKLPAKLPGFVARGNGSFELRDPYNMAEVYTVYYQVNGADAISLGAQPLSPDQTGQYHIPAWDGRWYYFPATRQVFPPPKYWMWKVVPLPVKMANPLLVDLEYEGTSVGGHTMYTSWISIREGRDLTNATLVTYVNGSTGTIETMHTPYTVTDEGNELFGIGVDRFKDGAVVTSHAPGFNVRTLDKGDYDLSSTTVTPGMTMAYTLLPDGTYATGIMAYYDNDAEVLADEFRFITIKNGALADTTVRPING